MKKWVIKAIVQKCISFLPYKHKVNYLFQKYVTKGVQLSAYYFDDRLSHFQEHKTFFEKYKGRVADSTILELGTGWYPVIPIGFFLSGAEKVYTVDISALTNREKVLETMARYLVYFENGQLQHLSFQKDRLETLCELHKAAEGLSLEEILKKLRIQYLVADARNLELPNDSIDGITSNNTFEHVYPDVLEEILKEFKRVLKTDGLMSHFIDMSDHFAHLDKTITIYNFLQFSATRWQFIDNTIQPQNRWRISHFRLLYEQLGIPVTEELNRPGDLEALNSVPIDKSFQHISKADLAISHSYLVSLGTTPVYS